MTKKNGLFFISLMCIFLTACASSNDPKKKQDSKASNRIQAEAGRAIASYGLSIDSEYDPRLAGIIEGYLLMPVSMKNVSFRAVPMDPKNDRWIFVGEKGEKYTAINSLRLKDPPLWRRLPQELRNVIDYPEIIPINYAVTFDLLLPKLAKLEYFREIRFYNATLKKEFIINKNH